MSSTGNHSVNNVNGDCCSLQVIFPPNPKSFWEELGESYAIAFIANLLFCLLIFLVVISIVETYYAVSLLPEFYTYNPIQLQH